MLDNVLLTAMSVIPPETITYEKYLGTTVNSIGIDIPTYSNPITTKASIQYHISERMYQAYGLSLNKDYALVDVPANLVGIENSKTPDRLTFHGKKWIIVKNNNWYIYNGWVKLIVVAQKDYETNTIPEVQDGGKN